MPFKEVSILSQRHEFVQLAAAEDANVRELCRRYGLSPQTGYRWIRRFQELGVAGLVDRSRKPHQSPARTSPTIEAAVLAVRTEHPAWGARKIRARLLTLGRSELPQPSTITEILRRHHCIDPRESIKHRPFIRFEHDAPNRLWQMDFKGHFALRSGRCHPLTVLDDHSRFALALKACADEKGSTVQTHLTTVFRLHGIPERILMDNGPPWGSDAEHPFTPLTIWLIRIGIFVSHGRPYHPQTQGKEERFHRTLKAEVLRDRLFADLGECQSRFDDWRDVYNLERPHEALKLDVPASRYKPSTAAFPERLPDIEYGPDDCVRKVHMGVIRYRSLKIKVGIGFHGYPVALRPTGDGSFDVFFCSQKIKHLNLREKTCEL
jgi:transposase InsO family protein